MPDINMQVFEEAKRNQLVTEIDIQTQVALDDYQVQLSDIANQTQSQDNVVIDRNGEFLPHWNESLDFNTWVKINMEIAGKRLLMLRGASNVNNVSSISDMSVDGSDFTNLTGWTQQAGSWSVSDGVLQIPESGSSDYYLKRNVENPLNTDYIVRSRFKIDENTIAESHHRLMVLLNSPTPLLRASGNDIMFYEQALSTQYNRLYHDRYDTGTHTEVSNYPSHAWLIADMQISDAEDKIILWSDDLQTNYGNHTTSNTKDGGDYWGIHSSYSKGEIDWIFIRKYATIEPTIIVDTPQNIAITLKSLGRAG